MTITLFLSGVVYYLLAHYLGLSLPTLVDPWRSLLIVTATVAATFLFSTAYVTQTTPDDAEGFTDFRVLVVVSYTAWAVLVVMTVRDRGGRDPLATLLACFAAVFAPLVWLVMYASKSAFRQREIGTL